MNLQEVRKVPGTEYIARFMESVENMKNTYNTHNIFNITVFGLNLGQEGYINNLGYLINPTFNNAPVCGFFSNYLFEFYERNFGIEISFCLSQFNGNCGIAHVYGFPNNFIDKKILSYILTLAESYSKRCGYTKLIATYTLEYREVFLKNNYEIISNFINKRTENSVDMYLKSLWGKEKDEHRRNL